MACEAPCFDCPFLREADKVIFENPDIHDFVFDHLTEDGGYKVFMCEEQEDVCIGWLQVIANGMQVGVEDFPHIADHIALMERNIEDYWQGVWEFMGHHD